MNINALVVIAWTCLFIAIWYKDGLIFNKHKWTFVPCTTPSESRRIMAEYIFKNKGTQYRLTVKGNQYGFEWR